MREEKTSSFDELMLHHMQMYTAAIDWFRAAMDWFRENRMILVLLAILADTCR